MTSDDWHREMSEIQSKKRERAHDGDEDLLFELTSKRPKRSSCDKDKLLYDYCIRMAVKHTVNECETMLRPDENQLLKLYALVPKLLDTAMVYCEHYKVDYDVALSELLYKKLHVLFVCSADYVEQQFLQKKHLDKDDLVWYYVLMVYQDMNPNLKCSEQNLYRCAGCLSAIMERAVERYGSDPSQKLDLIINRLRDEKTSDCTDDKR